MKKILIAIYEWGDKSFNYLGSSLIFITRLYLAQVFFMSGLTKISNWSGTLFLFENEYTVPVISSSLAAYFGTAAELILPIFLLFGFGSRFMIFALFVFNLVAAYAYSFLWTPDGTVGLADHTQWGLMLLLLLCTGYGKYSLDYLIRRFYLKMNDPVGGFKSPSWIKK